MCVFLYVLGLKTSVLCVFVEWYTGKLICMRVVLTVRLVTADRPYSLQLYVLLQS
jgi:hypothetical protein